MCAENSRTKSLEIPNEVLTIVASIASDTLSQPVWTLARQNNGFSLKIWKSDVSLSKPSNNAHSTASRRMNRNRRRMDAFLSNKKSLSVQETPGSTAPTSSSLTDIKNVREKTGCQVIQTGPESDCIVPTVTQKTDDDKKLRVHQADGNSSNGLSSTVIDSDTDSSSSHSPIANRTRSLTTKKSYVGKVGATDVTGHSSNSNLPVLQLPVGLNVTKYHEDY